MNFNFQNKFFLDNLFRNYLENGYNNLVFINNKIFKLIVIPLAYHLKNKIRYNECKYIYSNEKKYKSMKNYF